LLKKAWNTEEYQEKIISELREVIGSHENHMKAMDLELGSKNNGPES
jgi:hypothetical protein